MPVQRFAHKLLSISRPMSEIPGLYPKPIGRKGSGNPRPPLSGSILLPKTSWRPPVSGSQFPSYQVKPREIVTPRHHAGAPARTHAHSQATDTHTHLHTHTRSHSHRHTGLGDLTAQRQRSAVGLIECASILPCVGQPSQPGPLEKQPRLVLEVGGTPLPRRKREGSFFGVRVPPAPTPGPLSSHRALPRAESQSLRRMGEHAATPGLGCEDPAGHFRYVRCREPGGRRPGWGSNTG